MTLSIPLEPALSVGWFLCIWLLIWLPFAIPLAIALKWRPFQSAAWHQKLPLLATLYLIAPFLVIWFCRALQITLADCGLIWGRSLLIAVLQGLALALLSLLVLYGGQWGLGWIQWNPNKLGLTAVNQSQLLQILGTLSSVILPILGLGLAVSFVEELVFRGFFIAQLQGEYSPWGAAILSSLIFAILHLVWDFEQTWPQLLGLWLMGMVLAIARWTDGNSLGLPWGLHTGWILGLSVIDTLQWVRPTARVPTWVTGVNQSPLAGVTGLLLLGVVGGLLWIQI